MSFPQSRSHEHYVSAIGGCAPTGQPKSAQGHAAAKSRQRSPGFRYANSSQAPTGRYYPRFLSRPVGASEKSAVKYPGRGFAWPGLAWVAPLGHIHLIVQHLHLL